MVISYYNENHRKGSDFVMYSSENVSKMNNKKGYSQTHVHEFTGSTKIAEAQKDPHVHRLAGVTGEMIPTPYNSHKHGIITNTDFYEEHYHGLSTYTGPAIPVGNGRHVHFVQALTTVDDGHLHETIFATLIEDPTGD